MKNWLQVELAGAIAKETYNRKKIIPEAQVKLNEKEYALDLLVEDEWAIELKVINENDSGTDTALTVKSMKEDIAKLKAVKKNYSDRNIKMNTAYACVVFPYNGDSTKNRHEQIISEMLEAKNSDIVEKKTDFYFNDNSIKGTIYLAEVR